LSISVGILGATGYTGFELVRLLYNHPDVAISYCSSRQYNGKQISDILSSLRGYLDIQLEEFDAEKVRQRCDVVFSCLPHGLSMDFVPQVLDSTRVVDLSADFRLRDISVYTRWYKEHTSPGLIEKAVYGLCEVYREEITGARLVANPGCYPTSVLLPLVPLLSAKLVDPEGIIVDSKSGASGAGRGLSLKTHICEAGESFSAYAVGRKHRHIPEIEQELSSASGTDVNIEFIPHLVPISRGILSTIYVHAFNTKKIIIDELKAFYEESPFVQVLDDDMPSTKDVRGTNRCLIGIEVNPVTGKAIIVSVIDNLVKGASGQAIQNMNIMLGLDETEGLDSVPLFP